MFYQHNIRSQNKKEDKENYIHLLLQQKALPFKHKENASNHY